MPGLDFKSDLKILENDASVIEMALYAADEGIVDVYVKHLTFEELEELVNPRRQSGVVIEEIIDSSQQVDENVVHLNSKSVGSRLYIGYVDNGNKESQEVDFNCHEKHYEVDNEVNEASVVNETSASFINEASVVNEAYASVINEASASVINEASASVISSCEAHLLA